MMLTVTEYKLAILFIFFCESLCILFDALLSLLILRRFQRRWTHAHVYFAIVVVEIVSMELAFSRLQFFLVLGIVEMVFAMQVFYERLDSVYQIFWR